MTIEKHLLERSGATCELCADSNGLQPYEVSGPASSDAVILICQTCIGQMEGSAKLDSNHWRCLNTSMWSEVPAVQVMAWRLLDRLSREGEDWARDLREMLYLDDESLAWAKAGIEGDVAADEDKVIHRDSNGAVLQTGDTVVLIKDLDVKGGGFTAKRGTTVKGISLVENNSAQIEGRVNGQQIVILTQFVKKAGP